MKIKIVIFCLFLAVAGQGYWITTLQKQIDDKIDELDVNSIKGDIENSIKKLSWRIDSINENDFDKMKELLEEHDQLLDKIRDMDQLHKKVLERLQEQTLRRQERTQFEKMLNNQAK